MLSIIIILPAIFLLTFALGIITIPRLGALSRELHIYDLPDSRKVHKQPIPRTGGVAFLPIVIITITIALILQMRLYPDAPSQWEGTTIQHFLAYLAGAIMLYYIGLYDDIHGIGYKTKFIIQIIAAILLCISGLWIATLGNILQIDQMPWYIGMPFTILAVVYLTNAMNLIDGIDGLASGLSSISLAVIAALNLMSNNIVWAMLAIAFLGVVLSFFYYNVLDKKNKIFMGDAGSLTLGFTLSFLILHFWQANPVWNPYFHNIGIIAISTLVIPLFDVVRVFLSRLRDHRNPFLPDKNHIHHKFMRAGLSGHMTMIAILLISAIFIVSNYLVASFMSQTLIIVLDIALFCLMHVILNLFIWRKEDKVGIKWDRVL